MLLSRIPRPKKTRSLKKKKKGEMSDGTYLFGFFFFSSPCRRCFFYFRDSSIKSPEGSIEKPSSVHKLQELKERIRASELSLAEGYTSADTLGQWILKDLTAAILKDCPEGSQDTQNEIHKFHWWFANSKSKLAVPR
jgi:hypothetical protein